MALYIKNNTDKLKQVLTIYRGKRHFTTIYQGAQLVWQYVRSCFGRGYWINEKAWSNTDGWSN